MNIVIVNQWCSYENPKGGVGKYNYYLAKACQQLGHKVVIITSLHKGEKVFESLPEIDTYRIRQLAFPWFLANKTILGAFLRLLRDLLYSLSVQRILIRLNKKLKIDIVEYAEINSEGFIHAIFGPKEVPFVVRCHTPYYILKDYYLREEFSFSSPLLYWMERIFIRKALQLTTPSNNLKALIIDKFGVNEKKIITIPNFIDTDKFHPLKSLDDKNIEKIKILYVGRLERAKGIFVFAEAIKRLRQDYPGKIEAILVGADCFSRNRFSQRKVLTSLLSSEKDSEAVVFKGEVSEEELLGIYNECDIFVNPSLIYESFSYTCLEAMSCAKPVVASNIGGISEVVLDKETGFLFAAGNSEELVAKLKILIADPNKRNKMGESGRERAKNNFFSLEVVKKNIELYRRISNK
ncbi:MAG: glycosyltransferase family 4 protein [Candidatus Omnitrophica bacterium]|jgi:glycosyltransferase involved in cell wall biosynthesis|nr:glycosyltransferase family 4 protein [Candidatus Omnitrophota bacterium]